MIVVLLVGCVIGVLVWAMVERDDRRTLQRNLEVAKADLSVLLADLEPGDRAAFVSSSNQIRSEVGAEPLVFQWPRVRRLS